MSYKLNSKNSIKFLLVLIAITVFIASCFKQQEKADVVITAADRNMPVVENVSGKSYARFSHSVPEHKEIDCDSCHQRENNFATPEFPGHSSCINCHLNEFTNPESGICASCHDDLNVVPATMKPFPARFNEGFNMKFDHGDHISGAGRPREGCVACHKPNGAAQTIPVGIKTHTTCYTCHTPDSSIPSSCNACHELAPYKRTQPTSKLFNAVFRHSDHTSRQGVTCTECHTVKAGAPQSKQVAAPVAVQHFPAAGNPVSCQTCHNDRRAFGEADFANCKRCHTGGGFDMIPASYKAH